MNWGGQEPRISRAGTLALQIHTPPPPGVHGLVFLTQLSQESEVIYPGRPAVLAPAEPPWATLTLSGPTCSRQVHQAPTVPCPLHHLRPSLARFRGLDCRLSQLAHYPHTAGPLIQAKRPAGRQTRTSSWGSGGWHKAGRKALGLAVLPRLILETLHEGADRVALPFQRTIPRFRH